MPDSDDSLIVPVKSGGLIDSGNKAIAIAYCDSGLSLDITRDLEVWTSVWLSEKTSEIEKHIKDPEKNRINYIAGEGVGRYASSEKICISAFANDLLLINLLPLLPNKVFLNLEIIFPKGRELALKTSNQAFGVVDGLALIGTQAESQISASPDQLQKAIDRLKQVCSGDRLRGPLVFVIGENGFDLAINYGLPSKSIIKTGNWIGPLLVAAAEKGIEDVLLFGYHGKLIKLAGGIFHTHHHLADARLEILIALAVKLNVPLELIKDITKTSSIEEAWLMLKGNDSILAYTLWRQIALEIENKSFNYINNYISSSCNIGSVLFDRQRKIRWAGSKGIKQLDSLGLSLQA